MAGEVNLMLLIFAIALPHQEAKSNSNSCPHGSQPEKQEYFISDKPMTWEEADEYCEDHNGTMVELLKSDFADKVEQFVSNCKTEKPIWLGGKSEVGNFTYRQTKQPVDYNITGTSVTSCLLVEFKRNTLQNSVPYSPQYSSQNYTAEKRYICRKFGGEINGTNIYISNQTANLYHARNKCAEMFNNTGDLFYLKKKEDLNKLSSLNLTNINASTLYYTGACRLVWYWTESSNSIVFANWTSTQPNATSPSCLVYLPDGTLDDVNCNQKYRAFCVKNKPNETKCGDDAMNGNNTTEGFDDAITTEAPTTKNLPLWIGVGVSAGVALLTLIIVAILCCRKKCCGKKKPKENQNQFNYLSNTLETKSSHIYTTDPTYQADTVRGTNGVFGVYDTIDNLAPEGSTNNVSLTPDVTMRQTPANQNAVLRKDIYSQVVKKKNQNAEANLNKQGVQHIDVLQLDEPDSDNDDHDIIENDVYNFN